MKGELDNHGWSVSTYALQIRQPRFNSLSLFLLPANLLRCMMVAEIAADERLLTAEQVAQRLSVTEQTLAHWRSTGRVHLPYVAISRRCVRYREADVVEFVAERLKNHT